MLSHTEFGSENLGRKNVSNNLLRDALKQKLSWLGVEALSSYLYKQVVKEQFSPNGNLKAVVCFKSDFFFGLSLEFKVIKTTSLGLKEASFFY